MTKISPKAEPDAGIRTLIAQIDTFRPSQRADEVVSPKHEAQPAFDLEELLSGGARVALGRLSDAQLDRLRRKIEVARKLYVAYRPNLSGPASTEPLSASGVNQLCAVMLLAALLRRDARFLNSAFKLMDGLSIPANVAIADDLISLAYASLDVVLPLEPSPL